MRTTTLIPVLAVACLAACKSTSPDQSNVQAFETTDQTCDVVRTVSGLPNGIEITQCVSTYVPHSSKPELDRLQIRYASQVDRRIGRHTLPLGGKQLSVFIKLNGQSVTGPMTCSLQSGDDSECVVTLFRDESLFNVPASEGPVAVPKLFQFARNSPARIINAWDVEVAFTDGTSWDSHNGSNYKGSFPEIR